MRASISETISLWVFVPRLFLFLEYSDSEPKGVPPVVIDATAASIRQTGLATTSISAIALVLR
jgi:hypothetical protein